MAHLSESRYSSEKIVALTPWGFRVLIRQAYSILMSPCCTSMIVPVEGSDPWPRCNQCNSWVKLSKWRENQLSLFADEEQGFYAHAITASGVGAFEALLLAQELHEEVETLREELGRL